jgi:hypothetical protein
VLRKVGEDVRLRTVTVVAEEASLCCCKSQACRTVWLWWLNLSVCEDRFAPNMERLVLTCRKWEIDALTNFLVDVFELSWTFYDPVLRTTLFLATEVSRPIFCDLVFDVLASVDSIRFVEHLHLLLQIKIKFNLFEI